MRIKKEYNTLEEFYKEFSPEFSKYINGLFDANSVSFEKVETDNLEALALRNDFKTEGYTHWEELIVLIDPLVNYRRDFKSINPQRQGRVSRTELTAHRRITLYRDVGIQRMIPSFKERFMGKRTQEEEITRFFLGLKKGEPIMLEGDSLVIPIYADNSNYKFILDYIKSSTL